jgi:hypothetical protein
MTYEQALNWHKSRRERMMGNLLKELRIIILGKLREICRHNKREKRCSKINAQKNVAEIIR